MTLGQKQELFARCFVKLLAFAFKKGYDVRLGELWRSKAAAEDNAARGIGILNSAHRKKLAGDINLFKDGVYLTKTSDHAILGKYWKTLDPLCRWGGDFARRDGNHYSIEHNGVR